MNADVRINAILTHPEAEGREGLARHYAFATSESVEAAVAALRASGLDVTRSAALAGSATARRLLGLRDDPVRDARIAEDIASRTAQPAEQDEAVEAFRRDFESGRQAAAKLIGKGRFH